MLAYIQMLEKQYLIEMTDNIESNRYFFESMMILSITSQEGFYAKLMTSHQSKEETIEHLRNYHVENFGLEDIFQDRTNLFEHLDYTYCTKKEMRSYISAITDDDECKDDVIGIFDVQKYDDAKNVHYLVFKDDSNMENFLMINLQTLSFSQFLTLISDCLNRLGTSTESMMYVWESMTNDLELLQDCRYNLTDDDDKKMELLVNCMYCEGNLTFEFNCKDTFNSMMDWFIRYSIEKDKTPKPQFYCNGCNKFDEKDEKEKQMFEIYDEISDIADNMQNTISNLPTSIVDCKVLVEMKKLDDVEFNNLFYLVDSYNIKEVELKVVKELTYDNLTAISNELDENNKISNGKKRIE